MSTQDVLVRISADAAKYHRTMLGAKSDLHGFGQAARAEAMRIKSFFGSIHGQILGLGAGYGAMQLAKDSAQLQKETQLLKVATGGSREEMERWRNEMYQQQQITGTGVSQQLELSQALQAAGMGMGQITTTLAPASRAMAVAKANADQLGRAMGVAKEQFDIDLTNQDAVTKMLDQMVVAGRLGNAELENLPDIFARVGGRAREANMGMTDTLAIVETLSKSEPQAERLSTLVDSTLRVFTNAKYMKDAAKATGVKFFNTDGSRRDPLVVMQEMHKRYQELHSDAERMAFINKAFGKADMDTTRGMMKLLGGDTLGMLQKFKQEIEGASGQVGKDLAEAINNSVDQVSRLGGALREAVNKDFSDPLNNAINKGIQYLMNPREARTPEHVTREKGETPEDYAARRKEAYDRANNTGLGLSGNQLIAGGLAGLVGLYGLKYMGGKWISSIAGDMTDTVKGVGIGKVLQQAGVPSVYVVNMPSGGIGGADNGTLPFPSTKSPKEISKEVGLLSTLFGKGWIGSVALAAAPLAIMGGVTHWASKDDHSTEIGVLTRFSDWLGGLMGRHNLSPQDASSKARYDRGELTYDQYQYQLRQNERNRNREYSPKQEVRADPSTFKPYAQPIPGANPTEFAMRFTEAGAQMAQQNANAVNTIMQSGTAQQQAISSALIGQLNATKIMGNIGVTVSPSSELLNVSVRAVPGNANTQMTANVGRTGGPAS